MPYSDIRVHTNEDTSQRLVRLDRELRHASAEIVLRVAILREWPQKITYASSFGAESAIMLAMIADIDPDLPIIFLDTGMHFQQTLDYRDELIDRLNLTNVRIIQPGEDGLQSSDPDNKLWKTDPDRCCSLRKTSPLDPALNGFETWITGRKRFHGGTRLSLPVVEYTTGRFKINPMAAWAPDDIQTCFKNRRLPMHPLTPLGFTSIGCWPCTNPRVVPDDARSGRWHGRGKRECGLHTEQTERRQVF